MSPRFAITFDMDWAPDWAARECLDLCRKAGVKSTFFLTHAGDFSNEARQAEDVEIGIHPNFMPGSSHGADVETVLAHCMALAPEARAVRTHCLMQSTPLLTQVRARTPIRLDASLLLPFHPGLAAFQMPLASGALTRLPCVWEDDVMFHLSGDAAFDAASLPRQGLCVLSFHPVHIALNSRNGGGYHAVKAAAGDRRLQDLEPRDFAPHVEHGRGTRDFLIDVLQKIPAENFDHLSGLAGGTP